VLGGIVTPHLFLGARQWEPGEEHCEPEQATAAKSDDGVEHGKSPGELAGDTGKAGLALASIDSP